MPALKGMRVHGNAIGLRETLAVLIYLPNSVSSGSSTMFTPRKRIYMYYCTTLLLYRSQPVSGATTVGRRGPFLVGAYIGGTAAAHGCYRVVPARGSWYCIVQRLVFFFSKCIVCCRILGYYRTLTLYKYKHTVTICMYVLVLVLD